jgi:hypothetical protein
MKIIAAITLVLICFATGIRAQQTTVYHKKGYTLTFINYDATLDTALQTRMVNTFYTVYPELAKAYNKKTLRAVTMVIDTSYKGVAETANGKVTISNVWMHKHPEDIDVITQKQCTLCRITATAAAPAGSPRALPIMPATNSA